MKKYIIILLAGFSLGTTAAFAAADPSVTTDFTFASAYVFRGVKAASNSIQASGEITSGLFNIGVWTNQPVVKQQNNEIDLYAGFTRDLTSNLKLEGVGTYYWYPEAHPSLGQTLKSYETGLGLTYKVGGLSPSLYYYYDWRLKAHTLQGAIGASFPISAGGVSVDVSANYGNVSFTDGAPDAPAGPSFQDSYTYWGGDVSVPVKLNTNATFTIGAHYSSTDGNALFGGPGGSIPRSNFWFTAGLSVGF